MPRVSVRCRLSDRKRNNGGDRNLSEVKRQKAAGVKIQGHFGSLILSALFVFACLLAFVFVASDGPNRSLSAQPHTNARPRCPSLPATARTQPATARVGMSGFWHIDLHASVAEVLLCRAVHQLGDERAVADNEDALAGGERFECTAPAVHQTASR